MEHPNQYGPFEKGNTSMGWPEGRDRTRLAQLFCAMTNFVSCNHGWLQGRDLLPSSYLDIEITNNQAILISPTTCDVQIDVIIDQCIGKKSKKRISRRRIDFVSGNVNSYACILNGPAQLDKIRTYNDLTASLSEYQREKEHLNEKARVHKKKTDEDRDARKLEKDRKAREEHVQPLPLGQGQIEKGIENLLPLTLDAKRDILKHVFNHPEVKSALRVARANRFLQDLISPLNKLEIGPETNLTVGNGAGVQV